MQTIEIKKNKKREERKEKKIYSKKNKTKVNCRLYVVCWTNFIIINIINNSNRDFYHTGLLSFSFFCIKRSSNVTPFGCFSDC